jgi:hypothetical protein
LNSMQTYCVVKLPGGYAKKVSIKSKTALMKKGFKFFIRYFLLAQCVIFT